MEFPRRTREKRGVVIVLGLTLDERTIACILLYIHRQSARASERVRVCLVYAVNMV